MKRVLRPTGMLSLAGLIFLGLMSSAQPYPIRFQHLSIDQGLSYNEVAGITQDKYGFMWIGTTDGLDRFDGNKVEVYRHEPGNEKSLPSNFIRCLFTDSRGIVWIGTLNGLAYYDERTNAFHSFFQNQKSNSLPNNWIRVISEDRSGTIWIGTPTGLCSFDPRTNSFKRFYHDEHSNSISDNGILDIKRAPDGTMWISTSKGLNRLDLSTMTFTSFFHDPRDKTTLSSNALLKIVIDVNGDLWTFGQQSLYLDCFNTKTNHCKHFVNFVEKQSHIPVNFLRSICIDRNGRLWVGTSSAGLVLFDPRKNYFYEYSADPFDENRLHENNIINIYQDRSGLIWLATSAVGVERFNPDESKFIPYRLEATSSPLFSIPWVRAFAEDSLYRLWVGTVNGVFILDRNKGTYIRHQWKPNSSTSLNDNDVYTLHCDKSGKMWVGTFSGLNVFDPWRKNFQVFYSGNNDSSVAGNGVFSIVGDKNGDLLIGGFGGLSIYHSKSGRFSNFKNNSTLKLLNYQIIVVFEDRQGTVWVGTNRIGLLRYNRAQNTVENFSSIANDTSSIASNFVCSITQDFKGVIWVGTDAGLCRFNESTGTFTVFTEKNGLPNSQVAQLMVDTKNRLWMSTNKGISMLSEGRTLFTNYDPGDGLQGWEFSKNMAFKTHDGFFCYAGKDGFNVFHPDSIKKNSTVPIAVLKRIMIFDQPLKIDSPYWVLKSIKLSYKQNFFSFEFAALNYDHPEKNQYACQLIPFDKKMVQLGTNHSISYTNVPPGNYTLKVMVSNNDGVWNEKAYELNLIITPPFWATWWFRTLVIMAFLSAVFMFFKLRENRIKKEQARQTAINKQIAEIRMIALRAQMNPHFIFNCLNSIQHFITIREKVEALNYLSKFSKLIRQILENSRENTVSISNELQLLELYIQLEQLRFSNKFDYHIAIGKNIDIENIEIPPLLLQPYVENAILHGLVNKKGRGDLWFSLEKNDGLLICKVEDNGIGRARASEIEQKKVSRHKSLGIKVTNERISTLSMLLDYKMEVLVEDLFEPGKTREGTMQPSGTRVTISIPVKEEE